jgi:hypothetical protein
MLAREAAMQEAEAALRHRIDELYADRAVLQARSVPRSPRGVGLTVAPQAKLDVLSAHAENQHHSQSEVAQQRDDLAMQVADLQTRLSIAEAGRASAEISAQGLRQRLTEKVGVIACRVTVAPC